MDLKGCSRSMPSKIVDIVKEIVGTLSEVLDLREAQQRCLISMLDQSCSLKAWIHVLDRPDCGVSRIRL